MSICKWCGKEVPHNYASYHSRTCELNPNRAHNLQVLKDNGANTYKKLNKKRSDEAKSHIHIHEIKCQKCGKLFSIEVSDKNFEKGKYKKFCSYKCSNSHIISEETKNKISKGVILSEKYQNFLLKRNNIRQNKEQNKKDKNIIIGISCKIYKCKVCGKIYSTSKKYIIDNIFPTATDTVCSKECSLYLRKHRKEFLTEESIERLRQGWKTSASNQNKQKRSKNEKAFCELCEKHFSNVIHNKPIFNGWDADVILQDQKIAVLWNGKWHYEEFMPGTSLKMIQNRDKIKINEILKAGYIAYIIKDVGKYNVKFHQDKFNEFLEFVNNNEKIEENVIYR